MKKKLPFALDAFCGFASLSNIRFSPSGGSAAFTLTRADRDGNRYDSWLWLRKDGKNQQLTGLGRESRFVWKDERTILFASDREWNKEDSGSFPETKYYKIHTDGGEASLYLTFPVPVTELFPLKNGDYLVVATVFPGWEDLYRGDKKITEAFRKDRKENEDYEVITQLPWWWNGSGFTRASYPSLYRWDSRRHKLLPLLPSGMAAEKVKLDKNESFVYFLGHDATRPRLRQSGKSCLTRVRLDGGDPETLVCSKPGLEIINYEPADSFLYLLISDQHLGLNTDPDFYKMDYKTGEYSFCAKWGGEICSNVGSDVRYGEGQLLKADGDVLYFISTEWDGAYLYKLEDGKISKVAENDGSADMFDVCGGRVLLCGLFDMRPQELYEIFAKGSGAGVLKKVSSFNDSALKGRYVAQPEPLNFERIGRPVHGWVLKPIDYDPKKKYPCVLDIHGGPKTIYGPVFYHEMQYWAGKGYFVIFCNPEGSDGRDTFMDIRGRYGSVDYDDIMAFTDEALKAYPQIDPENLFETGGSYGGFMTNWIIGHTDRFRACASQRSISNWSSFLNTADIGPDFGGDQCGCDPWSDPEKLWALSPVAYADKAKTPTLFIHSFEDYRCPIDQGYQMYAALVVHGVESRLVTFKGENHELSRSGKPKHRIRRLKEITDWFEIHRK